jgi:hypothetical protein
MATATITRRPRRVRRSVPVRERAPRREQRLADAKAREVRARRDLSLAMTMLEWTYALAVRRFEDFDDYLTSVRGRLRRAGY